LTEVGTSEKLVGDHGQAEVDLDAAVGDVELLELRWLSR